MRNKTVQLITRLICTLLIATLIIPAIPIDISAAETTDDPFIVVSLGDSYSAGEGIPEFYGPDKQSSETDEDFWYRRIADNDFMAHRSPKSWPAQLKFSGVPGTMADYRVEDGKTSAADVQWYFAAVSGAKSEEIHSKKQTNDYWRSFGDRGNRTIISGKKEFPKQLDIISKIGGDKVDYVTMTIGGNDLGFSTIVKHAVLGSTYLHLSGLQKELSTRWKMIDSYMNGIKDTYIAVANAAPNAEIIVVGYPQLFERSGGGLPISKEEAESINNKVSDFNDKIDGIIKELEDNIKIHFVDVEDKFKNHEAYSSDSWINAISPCAYSDDLESNKPSAYSVHPNEKGAKAYAECVNAKIQEIESGTLSGKICKASDRSTPVTDATIHVTTNGSTKSFRPDSSGNYSVSLPNGTHLVKVTADGYIDFNAFATIKKDQTVYMETFLMVEGEESDIGEAIGTITNALTGNGVEGVTLDVRSGWNNTDAGDILTTVTTDASGNYTVTLPIGNYTLCASKAGYISAAINIVVQKDVCTTKNGSITPVISGNNFRVVLTWGSDPRDLDSHVVGTLSNGSAFHVYYSDKSEYDGDVEVCNLDVDDTTSYGPETITLNTTTNNPYYYYIYNFSSNVGMTTSEAQIKVYQGQNLVATFNVPTDQADARYWNVFAIVDGELIIRNTITSEADLSYANLSARASDEMAIMNADIEADMMENTK